MNCNSTIDLPGKAAKPESQAPFGFQHSGTNCETPATRDFRVLFPLTPTLSLGERENWLRHVQKPGAQRSVPAQDPILPLPEGEGRGEGEGSVQRARSADCCNSLS